MTTSALSPSPQAIRSDPGNKATNAALLDELGRVLLDCLRLSYTSSATERYILHAIRHCATEVGWNRVPATSNATLLPPWQEEVALTMLCPDNLSPVSIEDVAKACGVTATQFTRAFKAHFGVPPQRWRLLQRVERAKSLMRETNLSLTDIGYDCGFAEQSHFTHAFTKITGQTPRAWRHELIKQGFQRQQPSYS